MKELVRHLWWQNSAKIVEKSLLNCHARGVHSILFTPQIRLFIAEKNHELWLNTPSMFLSVGFHPHHCNLTLLCIHGVISNWTVHICDHGEPVTEYIYQSKIVSGKAGFKKVRDTNYCSLNWTQMSEAHQGEQRLIADEIHTIHVAQGSCAAWFVFEGAEDPNYKPLCWSNRELEDDTFEHLYQKPDFSLVNQLLESVNLL